MKKIINKITKKVGLFLAATLLLISCNDFSDSYTVDPNNVSTVPTAYLLSSAQKELVKRFLHVGDNDITVYDDFGVSYIQHIAGKTYTDTERVETEESSFNAVYAGGLKNLQEVIDLNTNEGTKAAAAVSGANNNQIAVAKIMLAWGYMNITDLWGHAPYSEALLGRENFSPKYDTQKEIYTGIISELKAAAALITTGTIEGDIIYGGDVAQWKKFAGSLLMRIGLRLSNADATMAKDAYTSGVSIGSFTSNSDNAMYSYPGGELNANAYWLSFTNGNRLDHAVSHTMVQMLGDNNDPRLPIYAKPIVSEATTPVGPADFWAKYKVYTVNGEKYAGQPWGYSNDNATELNTEQVSFVGTAFQDETAPTYLMTFAEVEFLKSEAIARGWASGNAETFYKSGIKASITQNGISAADADTYIDNETFAQYDAGNYLMSIGQQKWIAMYLQGLNTWSEWRRTGYPKVLDENGGELDQTLVPTRLPLPDAEISRNVNVNDLLISPTDMRAKVWWDVN